TEVLTEVSCQPEAEAICHQPWLDWQYELATNFTVDAGTPLPDAGSQGDGGRPLSSDAGQPASDSGDEVAPADAGALGDAGPSAPPPGPSRKNDDGGCSTTANQGLGAQLSGWLLAGFALLFLRRNKRG
ncbi:MAG: hypothetical protein JWN48_1707, partial [Myxococcaceae bacterium]|nr:hypothetical protein [Myxococcaceae bacterium]